MFRLQFRKFGSSIVQPFAYLRDLAPSFDQSLIGIADRSAKLHEIACGRILPLESR